MPTLAELARAGVLGAAVPDVATPEEPRASLMAALARAGLLGGPISYSEGRPSPLAVLGSMPREEMTAGEPQAPAPMLPTLSGVENQPSHYSSYQPRQAGRFAGPPAYPRDQSPRNDAERAVEEAATGIDYSKPIRRPPAVGGFMNESASSANDQPISRWLEQRGVRPIINEAERGARSVVNMAGEMTGIPAAGRAGRAFAEGDIGQGVGNALMSLPSRVATLPGFLLSGPAEAQQPDPRVERIRKLDADIARERKTLDSYATRNFPSTEARRAANKVIDDAITKAKAERDRLQGEMDAEALSARQHQEAEDRAATWRNTPTARAYPWAPPVTTGTGLVAAFGIPFTRARGVVNAHSARLVELDRRWADAVARAKNAQLAPQKRTQAANEARQLEQEFNAALGEARHPSRLGAAGMGFVTAEMGTGLPSFIDYLSTRGDPTGELAKYTLHANDPINNTGEVAARYLIPGMIGAGLGEVGNELGSRGGERPTGHSSATATLNRRYTRRSR